LKHLLLSATALLAAAALAAGCGSSSAVTVQADTTVSPNASLTKAKFIDLANQICMSSWHILVYAHRDEMDRLYKADPDLSDEELFAQATQSAYLPEMESNVVAGIRELGAPPGETQAVEEVIGSMQEAIERGLNGESVNSRPEIKALFGDYRRHAERYGLGECRMENITLPHPYLH
jgi:hypothetical protein